MSALPFDTYAFYTELVASGLAEKTADALTKAVAKIGEAKIDELATKRDIAAAKADLQRWIVTIVFAVGIFQTPLIAALLLKVTT